MFLLRLGGNGAHRHGNVQPGELAAVHQRLALHHARGRQVQQAGEGAVARVVRGHTHDRAVAVVRQHIVAHVHGQQRVGDGVHDLQRQPVAGHAALAHLVGTLADVVQLRVKGEA